MSTLFIYKICSLGNVRPATNRGAVRDVKKYATLYPGMSIVTSSPDRVIRRADEVEDFFAFGPWLSTDIASGRMSFESVREKQGEVEEQLELVGFFRPPTS